MENPFKLLVPDIRRHKINEKVMITFEINRLLSQKRVIITRDQDTEPKLSRIKLVTKSTEQEGIAVVSIELKHSEISQIINQHRAPPCKKFAKRQGFRKS